jgi:AraC-like DNA-binding protein
MAVDCCEHVIGSLANLPAAKLTSVASKDHPRVQDSDLPIDLIVIGVPRYPMRRLFISELRRAYPQVPVLILRRVQVNGELENFVRGEFVLSDTSDNESDLEIVRSLRTVLPIQPCLHVHKDRNYDTVRDVLRVLSENYRKPDLELADVARKLRLTPSQLSRVLNQQVGISFRQLLRSMRLEEAKRMLASGKYSIKEVAASVGFSDSHYFSRSFKELTGLSATEYRAQDAIFG